MSEEKKIAGAANTCQEDFIPDNSDALQVDKSFGQKVPKIERPATEETIKHYKNPKVMAVVREFCEDPNGWRGCNAGTHWYRSTQNGKVRLRNFLDDYIDSIEHNRVLYATLDFFEKNLKSKDEAIKPGSNKPIHPIGSLENLISYTLTCDIDLKGSVDDPSSKLALECAAQFFVDYLKKRGVFRSVYTLFSGNGIYILIHHNLFAVENRNYEQREKFFGSLITAYNMLIDKIETEFFKIHPEYKELIAFDTVNNKKRKLKCIFSIHAKKNYVVIPLDPSNIKIDLEKAKLPLSEEVIFLGEKWYKDFHLGEKEVLLSVLKEYIDLDRKRNSHKRGEKGENEKELPPRRCEQPILTDDMPPCIQTIISDLQPKGATGALTFLASYLYEVGWSEEEAFKLWSSLADKVWKDYRYFDEHFGERWTPSCEKLNNGFQYPRPGIGHYCKKDKFCKHCSRPTEYTLKVPNFSWNDKGNGERMAFYFGDTIKYCAQSRGWYVWDGKKWSADETKEFMKYAKKVVRNMYNEASEIENDDLRKKFVKWIHSKCETAVGIKHMVEMAESEDEISISLKQIYSESKYFNLENGVLNTENLEILPHDPSRLITMISKVAYDPNADCPRWKETIKLVFEEKESLMKYFQRVCGYILTGRPIEQAFFFLYGENGKNGKSTLMNAILYLMGDYGLKAEIKSFLESGNNMSIRNDLARMAGKRFVWASEPDEGKKYSMEILKQITGSEPITCRFLHQEYFEYLPQFSLFISANNRPTISEKSDAAWRRVQSIPFNKTIPEEMRDKNIDICLQAEASGIFNWMLEGLREYYKIGLNSPSEVLASIKEYKEDMNSFENFIRDCCVTKDAKSIAILNSELYENYKSYCEDLGIVSKDSLKSFIKQMTKLEEEGKVSRITVHKQTGWLGIHLKDDMERNTIEIRNP